jgi:tRNA G18 (ribose-2'-O)-methylase SpoU
MGTSFALPFARADSFVDTVTAARESGTLVVALTTDAGSMPLEGVLPAWRQRVMLVVGSERTGLSPDVLAACSLHACIPMAGSVDSMNAAAAVAVACYALRPRERGQNSRGSG